jgi:hypothetical protein
VSVPARARPAPAPDMERPVKQMSGRAVPFSVGPSPSEQQSGQRMSMVDYSDISGSGARPAVMVVSRRQLPSTGVSGLAETHAQLGTAISVPAKRCTNTPD